MSQNWGRNARLYVNDTLIVRSKDIENPDEAEVMKATARDLPYTICGQGGKETHIKFQIWDNDSASHQLLQNAYDNNTDDLAIELVKNIFAASSPNRTFTGVVTKFSSSGHTENGMSLIDVEIWPSDPEDLPARGTHSA